ncbi:MULTISPECIES: hypothetical protein [unclassified Mesorhizobium]|uniref:hypothetical protein n=1 Tax=unclassified Mesorhizobium TaxID=325217 RepID=UPI001129B905|nr:MULTISPECIES: hypothetical protein [unclassified Mesorhizobium]MBZ9974128.1 hypothetical protein [Mesorhizobium sp. BR-1-1-10]TPK10357.1 hypothetical protein FJ543_22895 [Mesorhizobium sp. B2-5-7]
MPMAPAALKKQYCRTQTVGRQWQRHGPKLDRGDIVVESTFPSSAEQPSRQSSVERFSIVLLRTSSQALTQPFIGRRQIGDYVLGAAKSRQHDFATRSARFDCFEKK